MGDFISWGAGAALLFFSALVMAAYRPARWFEPGAPGCLQTAIFLSFAAAGANTLWWQVIGQPVMRWELVTVAQFQTVGDYLDGLFKGSAAAAGYLHLRAIHLSMPPEERRGWSVLEMAFYPNRRRCLRLLANLTRRKEQ